MTLPISSQCFLSPSGARPVLPMVVAHEAIVKSFLSIGSSILSSHLPSRIILLFNFVGCAPSAPDGSSPRGYKRVLAACYRLNRFSFFVIASAQCREQQRVPLKFT
jgi:hypothetical protein